jgi:cyclopropane-fatty-acyl-phospholipid synthase
MPAATERSSTLLRDFFGSVLPDAWVPNRSRDAERVVRELFELADIQIGGTRPGDIRIHDRRFYERLLREASIGLGESYMDDWWETDALDVMIDKIVRADLKEKVKGNWRLRALTVKAALLNLQTKDRASAAIAAHYDIGNDLYTRMLDERMNYSCGYWKGGATTLAEAQEAKLDLICKKLGLAPGMSVLDIGCGWGGFAGFAAERYGCTIVGVTLSKAQLALGSQKTRHLPVELRLCDYRDVTGTFDRVVSIGMMEHVGPKNHRDLMRVIDRSLAGDGIALVHTIGNNKSRTHGTAFVEKYVFPHAVAPSLAQLGASIEGLFVAEDVHNLAADYDPTLMAWWANFDRTYAEIADRYDRRFYQMWKFYLLGAAGTSRARDAQLFQLVLTKRGRLQPDCRGECHG